MANGSNIFTDEQIARINASGLITVNENKKQLHYTNEFKVLAAYRQFYYNQTPTEVFEAYGLPSLILGNQRIKSAAKMWRNLYTNETAKEKYTELIKNHPEYKIDESALNKYDRYDFSEEKGVSASIANRLKKQEETINNLRALIELKDKFQEKDYTDKEKMGMINTIIEERQLNDAVSLFCDAFKINRTTYYKYVDSIKKDIK